MTKEGGGGESQSTALLRCQKSWYLNDIWFNLAGDLSQTHLSSCGSNNALRTPHKRIDIDPLKTHLLRPLTLGGWGGGAFHFKNNCCGQMYWREMEKCIWSYPNIWHCPLRRLKQPEACLWPRPAPRSTDPCYSALSPPPHCLHGLPSSVRC